MRLRQLFEDKVNDVAIMFGRFNPPHYGHKDAWLVASRFPQWYIGTNQSTQGPKDPLPFDIKIEAMKVLYPEIDGHLVAEQSWFTLAVMVYKKYGENATLHIVTDPNDKDVYVPMIQKQNGVNGDHGYYKFKSIEWARAERQSEASLVRKSVKDNKPDDFEKYSGVPADTVVAGKPYFDLVREYMFPYLQAEEEKLKKQQERDRLKAEKEQSKKAKSANKVKDAVPEDAPMGNQLSVQQLATISDEALDKAYGYGRSSPGNTFGWQANLKSAAYAKQMIDKGVTDIEAISDAIHKGWNVTAKAFVTNPDQFDDTEKLRASGKLDAKLQQREKLMNIAYAQLSDEEQEKDRVVARALLTAIKGQGVAEAGIDTGNMPVVRLGGTVSARPAVKVGSLVKAQGLDGVWRVDQVRGDNASITMERPNTGVSRNIPVSALRVWTNKPITPLRNDSMSERVRDPEDWDEGNTEPGNNFAVYINGKKWKVFPGPYGAYADSPEERREFQRLKDMAERKSQQTGKKWEVYITGEPATR
jgi:hypothetical protein